jgi:hypothetical protein
MEPFWILEERFTEFGERLYGDNDPGLVVESPDE